MLPELVEEIGLMVSALVSIVALAVAIVAYRKGYAAGKTANAAVFAINRVGWISSGGSDAGDYYQECRD